MYADANDNLPAWLRRLTPVINTCDWTAALARLLGAGAGCLADPDNFRRAVPNTRLPSERADWSAWGNAPDGHAITNAEAAAMFREFYAQLDRNVLLALRREARRWYADQWFDTEHELWCGPRQMGHRPALVSAALGMLDQCRSK